MGIRPFPEVIIQQITPFSYRTPEGVLKTVSRRRKIQLDFAIEYESNQGWEKHTDDAMVSFPKNVLLSVDENQCLFQQSGSYNVIIGGSSTDNINSDGTRNIEAPLIMRGDKVTISSGYRFRNQQLVDQLVFNEVFTGFVSKVNSKIPIEIELEDNFFLLKRTPVSKSVWKGDLVDLCKYMISECNNLFGLNSDYNTEDGNPYPILSMFENPDSLTANFSLGHLDIGDVTCSQLLSRVESQYHLKSFFYGNVFHFGFPIYDESRSNSKNVFEFQNNIIDDKKLEYRNKGDVVLSAIVSCRVINKTGKRTKDGLEATKRAKVSVLVYWDLPTESWKYISKKKDEPFPSNTGGERHEFIYAIDPSKGSPSAETLFEYGKQQLEKYYYTGFKGSFTTFGFPIVRWGDNVNLVDNILADRNGQYKVKKVKYTGLIEGLRQEIFLDYKLNIPPVDLKNCDEIYMI